jgi:hypothetical protein
VLATKNKGKLIAAAAADARSRVDADHLKWMEAEPLA